MKQANMKGDEPPSTEKRLQRNRCEYD